MQIPGVFIAILRPILPMTSLGWSQGQTYVSHDMEIVTDQPVITCVDAVIDISYIYRFALAVGL